MVEQVERRRPENVFSRWLMTSGSPTSPNYPQLEILEQWTQYERPSTYTSAGMTRVYNELIALLLPLLETQVSSRILTDINKLKEEVQEVRDYMICRPLVSSLLLSDLGDSKIGVISPISVVLEETEEESLARWPEVRASGIGATSAEAIANLKSEIVELYSDLVMRERESLGEIALYTLSVFNAHIGIKE